MDMFLLQKCFWHNVRRKMKELNNVYEEKNEEINIWKFLDM